MAVPNRNIRFTYDDYQTLPESMAGHYELLDGDIVMVPSPTIAHQRISRNLEFLLLTHVRSARLGVVLDAPVDVVLGEGDEREVVEPDILFVGAQRRHIITDKEVVGAPDLVVEVLSPGTRSRDRGYKRALYGRYGVREYWIVDPDTATIEICQIRGDGFSVTGRLGRGDALRSDLFPGMALALDDVFDSEM